MPGKVSPNRRRARGPLNSREELEEEAIKSVSQGVGMGACLWPSHRPVVFET